MKIISILGLFFFASCQADYTPKPKGFLKISLPEKKYQEYEKSCPFAFQFPIYSIIRLKEKNCFFDIKFSNFKATLHVSYFPINDNLHQHIEESSKMY